MILHVDELLVQKLITLITLEVYFPLGLFIREIMTTTHIVSCYKTKKIREEKTITTSLQCLPSLFNGHDML